MAKYGNYGWSPRQMERINERRDIRGQEELRNIAYEGRQSRDNRGAKQPKLIEDEDEEKSLAERQAERMEEFRKKLVPATSLNPQTSLLSNKDIKDEEFNRRFGRGPKGISTPVMQGSFNRIVS